jgi:hypothetical protein
MALTKVVTSPHILVFINGHLYSHASGLSWSASSPRIKRTGVDSIIPYELSPSQTQLSGRIKTYRAHGDGGLEGRGIVAPPARIPEERYFSLLVIDRITGDKILQADHCMVEDQSWDVSAGKFLEGSFSFTGLTHGNEAEYY